MNQVKDGKSPNSEINKPKSTFTKEEAIGLMNQGKRVTHRLFSSHEWMKLNEDGHLLLGDGSKNSLSEFFIWRSNKDWNDGYSLYDD